VKEIQVTKFVRDLQTSLVNASKAQKFYSWYPYSFMPFVHVFL